MDGISQRESQKGSYESAAMIETFAEMELMILMFPVWWEICIFRRLRKRPTCFRMFMKLWLSE